MCLTGVQKLQEQPFMGFLSCSQQIQWGKMKLNYPQVSMTDTHCAYRLVDNKLLFMDNSEKFPWDLEMEGHVFQERRLNWAIPQENHDIETSKLMCHLYLCSENWIHERFTQLPEKEKKGRSWHSWILFGALWKMSSFNACHCVGMSRIALSWLLLSLIEHQLCIHSMTLQDLFHPHTGL